MKFRQLLTGASVALLLSTSAFAIDQMEVDDFEDGTTENWDQGVPGQPTNEADGGPGGAGDNYLQTVSTGTSGPSSRMAVRNLSQWTGDYNAVGSEVVITMWVANLGAVDMTIRIGVQSTVITEGGTQLRWVTTNGFSLPADGVWREASFTLSESEMTDVSVTPMRGGGLSMALDNVDQFRVISAASPQWRGDVIAATLGMDDISVTQVPVELQSFSID